MVLARSCHAGRCRQPRGTGGPRAPTRCLLPLHLRAPGLGACCSPISVSRSSARAAGSARAAFPARCSAPLPSFPPFQPQVGQQNHPVTRRALPRAKGEEAATARGAALGMEPSIRWEGAPEHGTVSRLPVTNSAVYFDENFSPPGTEIIC